MGGGWGGWGGGGQVAQGLATARLCEGGVAGEVGGRQRVAAWLAEEVLAEAARQLHCCKGGGWLHAHPSWPPP